MNKVCIVGLGYIGLPTAVVAAKSGLQVAGFDTDNDLIKAIQKNKLDVSEPGLAELLSDQLKEKNFTVHDTPTIADVYVVCVPTPLNFINNVGKPDLKYVFDAIESLLPLLKEKDLIIIESTCPVGTTDIISKIIKSKRSDIKHTHLAYCPERILPGNALFELINNGRIVGGINKASARNAKLFYKNFVKGKIHLSDTKTAEMCKLVENSYRDVNIAFANEISMIASEFGVNTSQLIKFANMHPRVSILQPGVGVGGHCLPIDPWFLIDQTKTDGLLMKSARQVNKKKTYWTEIQVQAVIDRVRKKLGRTPKIAVLGITYKPNTEDYRESPALDICISLMKKNKFIKIVDPHVKKHLLLELVELDDAIDTCDIFIMLVPHKAFNMSKKLMSKTNQLYDFCER